MKQEQKRDSMIAAAVTFAAVLLILLLLFFGSVTFTPRQIARDSTPELMPLDDEEELFIEPEIERNLGEENAVTNNKPAPAFKGTPEQAETENTKLTVPGTSTTKTPPVEKPIATNKESEVKATEPPKENEDKKKVTSKMADKFSTTNGTETGTSGTTGAGDTGVGVLGSVAGRTFLGCNTPKVALRNKVVVVVNVTIDSAGRVTAATARSKSGSVSSSILQACETAARTARWSEDKNTPSAKGTITFTITPK